MTIAIDYDGTITADMPMWVDVIKTMILHGHQVIIATMRTKIEGAVERGMSAFLNGVNTAIDRSDSWPGYSPKIQVVYCGGTGLLKPFCHSMNQSH